MLYLPTNLQYLWIILQVLPMQVWVGVLKQPLPAGSGPGNLWINPCLALLWTWPINRSIVGMAEDTN